MRDLSEPGLTLVAPSILAADHADLQTGVARIEQAGAEWVHLDIMDGHFVPNLTFGPQTVADLRRRSALFFDVHLMLSRPDRYFDAFIKAGADLVSVHIEPEYDVGGTLSAIRRNGCRCGLVLNPDTPLESVVPYLEAVDLVLQMTVFPGFGGQSFMSSTLPKIERLKQIRDAKKLGFRIEVDGGIDLSTCGQVRQAGADTLVSGSAFFRAEKPSLFLTKMLDPALTP